MFFRESRRTGQFQTSANYVYIYTVDITQEDSEDCFNYEESGDDPLFIRQSPELFLRQRRPQISIQLAVVARLENSPTSVVSLKDELFVCLTDGWVRPYIEFG